jgi:two-component system phosphate regulon response regulator PhoB
MDIRTVLIAEDDPLIRRVTELALKREGYTVHAVCDGQEAVDSATAAPVDLIILDGMMPRLDGIEACRMLKQDPRTAHIPVILLSARSQNGDEESAMAAGADGYIRKPFDALALGQTLRSLCDKIPA